MVEKYRLTWIILINTSLNKFLFYLVTNNYQNSIKSFKLTQLINIAENTDSKPWQAFFMYKCFWGWMKNYLLSRPHHQQLFQHSRLSEKWVICRSVIFMLFLGAKRPLHIYLTVRLSIDDGLECGLTEIKRATLSLQEQGWS